MSLFDRLVDQALSQQVDLAPLRVVVEKELLHHDVMRVLSDCGLLDRLCFIGGTCLRACYGSNRLSEDLDFTGGVNFDRAALAQLKPLLTERLQTKYGLAVEVSEPKKEVGNVDTWKLKVQTRPEAKNLPAQRINIDVCSIPSYQPRAKMLLNPYGVDMGTAGLIVRAESLEEIYADKILAFGLRRGRIKNRDIWDLLWLKQRLIVPAFELIPSKLDDHGVSAQVFLATAQQRARSLVEDANVKREFRLEMQRFLPAALVAATVNDERFWAYLAAEIPTLMREVTQSLDGKSSGPVFRM